MTTKYRAKKSFHAGRGVIVTAGDPLPDTPNVTDELIEQWLERDVIEMVTSIKPVASKTTTGEPDTPTEPTLKTSMADLDFIGIESTGKLSEVGINTMADLNGWESDELLEIETIGKSKCKRLLELFGSLDVVDDNVPDEYDNDNNDDNIDGA